MKICMMTNIYLPHVGGVARSVHTFAEDFRRRRHTVLIAAPRFPGEENVAADVERHVVRLPALQQFNGSDFSVVLPGSWLLNSKLGAFEPDVVHSHHPYLIGDAALRYASDKKAPVIFTHHTLYEQYTHYVPFDSSAFKAFVVELGTQYSNLCDAVIAPSESIARLIRQRGVTSPIEVIPTGIDVQAFAGGQSRVFRERHDLPSHAFVVGHLGRLAPEKNLEYLGRAVCRFLSKASDAVFLVVGEGPSAARLSEIFAAEHLTHRLILAGKQTGGEVYDAYAAMDAFAFSSLTETQGMVLAEAMAAGLPVVALDAPGVREIVRDGRNGLLLPADADEERFCGSLDTVRTDRSLREELRVEARRTAGSFDRAVSASRTLSLYRRVRRTRSRVNGRKEDEFKALLGRLELEWALISEKAGAAAKALGLSRR